MEGGGREGGKEKGGKEKGGENLALAETTYPAASAPAEFQKEAFRFCELSSKHPLSDFPSG